VECGVPLSHPISTLNLLGSSESHKCFENRRDFWGTGAYEIASDGRGGDWGGGLQQEVADEANTLGEGRRPGQTNGSGGPKILLFDLDAEAGLSGGEALELGAEPADEAGAFLGGAGGVQFHETEEDVLGREIGGPAVGFGDGAVEVVVQAAENRDEAVIVDHLAGGAERLSGAEFLEGVVT